MLLYSLPSSYKNFCWAIESRDMVRKAEALKVKILEESNARKQDSTLNASEVLWLRQDKTENKWNSSWNPKRRKKRRLLKRSLDSDVTAVTRRITRHRSARQRARNQSTSRIPLTIPLSHQPKLIWVEATTHQRRLLLDLGFSIANASHICPEINSSRSTSQHETLNLANNTSTEVEGREAVRIAVANNEKDRLVELRDILFVSDL